MTPTFFRTPEAFRRWLAKNHDRKTELWVGFYKVASGKGGMVYKQALDEALCFGWIDGLAQGIDEESYAQRFTPRKKRSNWSRINIRRVQELMAEGRMEPPGIAAFEARDETRTGVYSFEQGQVVLSPEYQHRLDANAAAAAFFNAESPWYRRVASWWVMSAKKEETRERRLARLIEDAAAGRRIKEATPGSSKTAAKPDAPQHSPSSRAITSRKPRP